MYTHLELLSFFFIYAFLGWGVEIAYHALTTGHLVNRGMLAGPVCPIYGFGVVFIMLLLAPIKDQIILLFLGITLLCTVLELLAGMGLKFIFQAQWWDYSQEKFNIAGLICPKFSIYWGIGGLFLMKIIHPLIENLVFLMPSIVLIVCCILAAIAILIDMFATVAGILHLRRREETLRDLQQQIFEVSERLGQNITELTLDAQARIQPVEQRLNDIKEEFDSSKDNLLELAQELRQDYEDYRTDGAQKHFQRVEKYRLELNERKEALEKRYQDLRALPSRTEKRLLKAFPDFHWNTKKKK